MARLPSWCAAPRCVGRGVPDCPPFNPSLIWRASCGRQLIFGGDFNAQRPEWWSRECSQKPDRRRCERGDALAEAVWETATESGHTLECMNNGVPTHEGGDDGGGRSVLDLVFLDQALVLRALSVPEVASDPPPSQPDDHTQPEATPTAPQPNPTTNPHSAVDGESAEHAFHVLNHHPTLKFSNSHRGALRRGVLDEEFRLEVWTKRSC